MTCKEIMDRLQDYLDGDLKEKHMEQIEIHLERCASCREEYRTLKQISELFRRERIQVPDEEQWKKTWKNIELQIAEPKLPWFREIIVTLDTLAMKLFAPRSLALRASFSMGLFALGIVLGSVYLAPSGEIYQKIIKVEHQVKEVPVIQKQEVIKVLEKKVPVEQVSAKVVQQPRYVVLASKPIEPAPIFAATEDTDINTDTQDIWTPKTNVDEQIQKIKKELAPSFNQINNAGSLIQPVNMTQ